MVNKLRIVMKCISENWKEYRPPSIKGTTLIPFSMIKKLLYPHSGYHFTQLDRVSGQLKNKKFDNIGKSIYFNPFLYFTKVPPFNFGGDEKGSYNPCWKGKNPVMLMIGSKKTKPIRNIFGEKCFPSGPHQDVEILGAWKCNPEWVKSKKLGKTYPTLVTRICLAVKAAVSKLFSS